MIIKYEQSEYKTAKSYDLLKLQCHHCNKIYLKRKKDIARELAHNLGECKYCSSKCHNIYKTTSINVNCTLCNKEISRKQSELKKSKLTFCSKSCMAKYYNKHRIICYKIDGKIRSKLELYIEQQLKNIYPNLEILFNERLIINSELDIYIPSLKLAFELNGIYHYEPIHGLNALTNIENNDQRKFLKCHENNISLCVIDTSKQTRFTEKSSIKYLNIITELINKHLTY